MIQKLDLSVAGRSLSVYADDETAIVHTLHTPLHKHGYGELHCILRGSAAFQVEGKEWRLAAGEALYIPKGYFHSNRGIGEPLDHLAFPLEAEGYSLFRKSFSVERLENVFAGIRQTEGRQFRAEAVHALLFFLADLFFPAPKPENELPYEAAIDRFISRHYPEPLTVRDLAAAIHLSETQAERVMRRVTGKTFLAHLTDYRLEIAGHLSATTTLTLAEIARRVGYQSYPGFYKARQKKHKEEKAHERASQKPDKL